MSTLPPSEKRVKVVAKLTRQRECVLVDEPLSLDTLALLQPTSPLSKAFLDGAGLPYIPHAIAVYVDGKRVWERNCPHHGATDTTSNSHAPKGGHNDVHAVPFTKAFPDLEYDDERIAARRAAWEHLRNDPDDAHWAEDFAADLIEAAGSLRPKLRPAKPEPELAVDPTPYPCERYGDSNITLGLPYKPSGSWRPTHIDNAGVGPADDVEFLPAYWPYVQQ